MHKGGTTAPHQSPILIPVHTTDQWQTPRPSESFLTPKVPRSSPLSLLKRMAQFVGFASIHAIVRRLKEPAILPTILISSASGILILLGPKVLVLGDPLIFDGLFLLSRGTLHITFKQSEIYTLGAQSAPFLYSFVVIISRQGRCRSLSSAVLPRTSSDCPRILPTHPTQSADPMDSSTTGTIWMDHPP